MIKSKPLPSLERLHSVFAVDSKGRLFWKAKPHAMANGIKIGREITTRNIDGYYRVNLDGKTYPVHRIVWAMVNGADPGEFSIDHINGIVNDNRPENLRLATPKQNAKNRVHSAISNTGEKYITYAPYLNRPRPYVLNINKDYVGYFETLQEAVTVRESRLASQDATWDPFDPFICRA